MCCVELKSMKHPSTTLKRFLATRPSRSRGLRSLGIFRERNEKVLRLHMSRGFETQKEEVEARKRSTSDFAMFGEYG